MIEDIKILHIVQDEKFIDSACKWFEATAPLCNTFLLPSRNKKLKYIKDTPVKIIDPLSYKNPVFMKSMEKYDIHILHSLSTFNKAFVVHANLNFKFVWIGMGYDYYDIIYNNPMSLYQEQTVQIVNKLKSKHNKENILLKKLFRYFCYKNMTKKDIIEKIDFFAPVLENEYEMVASNFSDKFPAYIGWNYGSTANIIEGKLKNSNINGNNILVGNSASPENNHIEVFELLKNQNIIGRNILCPLNYGDYEYASILKSKGRDYFGESFKSIDSFMTIDDYIDLICSCSNVIMNHHRQQGGGNVSIMLYMGAKVFLNKVNPLYAYYKEKGATIFCIEELNKYPTLLDLRLSEADIQKNKQIIKLKSNEEWMLGRTEHLIKKVIYCVD